MIYHCIFYVFASLNAQYTKTRGNLSYLSPFCCDKRVRIRGSDNMYEPASHSGTKTMVSFTYIPRREKGPACKQVSSSLQGEFVRLSIDGIEVSRTKNECRACFWCFTQEQLDTKLVDRQALETGICPVREDLYTQAFGKRRRHVR